MGSPDRPAVEGRERRRAAGHVGKPAEPGEDVGPVDVSKLGNHPHAGRFLRLDELAVEEGHKSFPLTRMQRVLAQLHDGTAGRGRRGRLDRWRSYRIVPERRYYRHRHFVYSCHDHFAPSRRPLLRRAHPPPDLRGTATRHPRRAAPPRPARPVDPRARRGASSVPAAGPLGVRSAPARGLSRGRVGSGTFVGAALPDDLLGLAVPPTRPGAGVPRPPAPPDRRIRARPVPHESPRAGSIPPWSVGQTRGAPRPTR
jgi:hypothetical protein